MTLTSFNIIELSTAAATILGAFAMLLAQTQKSKCKNLKICWGCVVCDRTVDAVIEEEPIDNNEVDLEGGEKLKEIVPKIELPKVELPKVELPKVNIIVKK